MILGAKKFYFGKEFYQQSKKIKWAKLNMILITIVDKKIYYEYNYHGKRGTKTFGLGVAHMQWLYDSLMKIVPHKDFPDRV